MKWIVVAVLAALLAVGIVTPVAADTGSDVTVTATPPTLVPIVASSNATGIISSSATLHGNITDTEGDNASLRGFEWGLSAGNYTWSWNQTGDYGTGVFEYQIPDLTAETHYYWRALAENVAGIGYSGELDFWTTGECYAPTNFTITRTGTNSINITWERGPSATLTVIRGSTDGYPEDVTDGYLVYSGNSTFVEVDGLSLNFDKYYYRAWSWNEYGYSEDYAEDWIGGNAMLAIFLGGLALGITGLSFWRRALILTMGASLSWLALGILLLADASLLGLPSVGESWVQIVAYLFFVMTVGCILWYISGLGKVKITQTDTKGRSWVEEGKVPKRETEPRAQKVKTSHRDRLRKFPK